VLDNEQGCKPEFPRTFTASPQKTFDKSAYLILNFNQAKCLRKIRNSHAFWKAAPHQQILAESYLKESTTIMTIYRCITVERYLASYLVVEKKLCTWQSVLSCFAFIPVNNALGQSSKQLRGRLLVSFWILRCFRKSHRSPRGKMFWGCCRGRFLGRRTDPELKMIS